MCLRLEGIEELSGEYRVPWKIGMFSLHKQTYSAFRGIWSRGLSFELEMYHVD